MIRYPISFGDAIFFYTDTRETPAYSRWYYSSGCSLYQKLFFWIYIRLSDHPHNYGRFPRVLVLANIWGFTPSDTVQELFLTKLMLVLNQPVALIAYCAEQAHHCQ